MGALRFKTDENGQFLSHEKDLATPPWTSLRDLEFASLELEKEGKNANEELKWLNMLMAPGSSLGGARPKASVVDIEGNLWIAKFPSNSDEYDTGAWEMVVHELAAKCGLDVAPAQVQKFSGRHRTFITGRFDRIGKRRIHFASAMTLLGHQDGADFHDGISYLDLATFIMQNGGRTDKDLKELWSRIVFNILVKNTDDHLRNHGFLLGQHGWELSPAYDMNPVPMGNGLTLNISEDDNSLDIELAMDVSLLFRVKLKDGEEIANNMKRVVAKWAGVATEYKISRREQEEMAEAFYL